MTYRQTHELPSFSLLEIAISAVFSHPASVAAIIKPRYDTTTRKCSQSLPALRAMRCLAQLVFFVGDLDAHAFECQLATLGVLLLNREAHLTNLLVAYRLLALVGRRLSLFVARRLVDPPSHSDIVLQHEMKNKDPIIDSLTAAAVRDVERRAIVQSGQLLWIEVGHDGHTGLMSRSTPFTLRYHGCFHVILTEGIDGVVKLLGVHP